MLLERPRQTLEATLDDKFKEFKKEVQDSQDQSVERVAKKVRAKRPSSFRFKGNEDQFYFNQKVIDTVDEASAQFGQSNIRRRLLIVVQVVGHSREDEESSYGR